MQTRALLFACLLVCIFAQETLKYTLLYDSSSEESKWEVKEGEIRGSKSSGWAVFEPHTNHDGWAKIHFKTNSSFSDDVQSYAAGYLEGYATFKQIQTYWPTYQQVVLNVNLTTQLNDWLQKNMMFMLQNINKKHDNEDEKQFWNQANLLLTQVHGIYDGYSKHFDDSKIYDPSTKLSFQQIYLLQLDGDAGDLYNTISPPSFDKMSREDLEMYTITHGHCSVVIRYNDDRTNLFMTHSTWDTFANMLRMFKHAEIPLSSVAAKTVSFSSSPGWIASVDDYYVTSTGLFITETTNNVFNTDLYKYVKPESVLYWMRNTIANRLSKTGDDWVKFFSMYNSGTYNNQWMIVDTKLFQAGAAKSDEKLLTILEQMPHIIHTGSGSEVLDKQGYWASYNIPYYPDVYNASGYLAMYQKYGDDYGYLTCPRARIFARDANKVNTFEQTQFLIRYNNWEHDPLSNGNACHSIAARCDLNPPGAKRAAAFGQIDAKVTDIARVKQLVTEAQCGPTHYQQPIFKWIDRWANVPHAGQPNAFPFGWTKMSPKIQ